jgi:O-antigen/teichoic acid export membrane protein
VSLPKNTAWNIAGSAVPLIVAVFSIPVLLEYLGPESFGLLALLWTLIGYLSLFDLGIGRALTYEVSKLRGSARAEAIPSAIAAGLMLTLIAGLAGAALVGLLAPTFVKKFSPTAETLPSDATMAFQIAAIGVASSTVGSGARGALEGLSRFDVSNVSKMVVGAATFGLPVVAIWNHGPSLAFIAAYLVAARVLVAIFLLALVNKHCSIRGASVTRSGITTVLSYGSWVTVTGIVGPLMVYGDRFFVGAAIGAAMLAYYAIPQEALQRLLIFPSAVCGALLPVLASERSPAAGRQYSRYRVLVAAVMGVACIATSLLAQPALELWISSEFADTAAPIVVVLSIGIWLNSIASLPYTLLHAKGAPNVTALIHCFELPIYFWLLWWATKQYGLLGAAWVWTGRATVDLMLMEIAARRFGSSR